MDGYCGGCMDRTSWHGETASWVWPLACATRTLPVKALRARAIADQLPSPISSTSLRGGIKQCSEARAVMQDSATRHGKWLKPKFPQNAPLHNDDSLREEALELRNIPRVGGFLPVQQITDPKIRTALPKAQPRTPLTPAASHLLPWTSLL
jgi:hypothetical protein